MNISTILTPVFSAGIGYVTNYIAVKMLFRPLKPVKIGNFKVPFTPGVIPKEKNRLAQGIGEIVGQRLVTKEGIEQMLLSDDIETALKKKIQDILLTNNTCIQDVLLANMPEEKVDMLKENITSNISEHVKESLLNSNIGDLLAQEIVKSIKEHLSGGFLAMMLNDSLLNSIAEQIAKGLTAYLESHAEELLKPYIASEYDSVMKLTLQDANDLFLKNDIPVTDIIYKGYVHVIKNNLSAILSMLNITQIAKQQIEAMDVLELEEMILSVMKKELNAVVNLGALIGLALGIINVLIA